MEPKGYKSLGNTIREAVRTIKNAPTMLPEETIEKLGLTEEDILTVGDVEELDEAKKKKLTQRQTMKVLDALDDTKYTGERGVGLHHLLKDLKVIDGKVNFNVAKTIKLIKRTIDALKTLEKDSAKEFDRLDATLEEKGGIGYSEELLPKEADDLEETYVNLDEITSKEADKLSNAAHNYEEALQEASGVAQLLRELVTRVNRLAKSPISIQNPHGRLAKKYAKIFQDTLNHTKRFKTLAKSAAKDLQRQADERWKDDDDETFHAGTKKKKSTKRAEGLRYSQDRGSYWK